MRSVKYLTMMRGKREEDKFELRLKLVQTGLEQGIRETSRAFRCDRNTVRKWLRRYKEEGLSGLQERSSSPKRIPHKTSVYLEEKVLKARETSPCCGAKRLKEMYSLKPSVGAIARILRQKGLTKKHTKNYQEKKTLGEIKAVSHEISSDNPKHYKSLGSLIRDYRQWRGLSQETLVESIRISARELRNWETGRCRAHMGSLHDLSEVTGIPMQVCVALNTDQPIWYSLRDRWFAYSSTEVAQFKMDNLLKSRETSEDGIFTKSVRITTDKQIKMILARHQEIYNTERPLGSDVVKAASMILPDLNCIIFDCWGHYVGHQICLPIKMDVYQELKKQKVFESYLTAKRVSDIVSLHEGVFFFYSIFAVSASLSYPMIVNSVRYHAKIEPKEKYLVVCDSPVTEIKEFCKNVGNRIVRNARDNAQNTEVAPTMFEIELDVLMRPLGPFGALRWMVEEYDRERGRRIRSEAPLKLRPQ